MKREAKFETADGIVYTVRDCGIMVAVRAAEAERAGRAAVPIITAEAFVPSEIFWLLVDEVRRPPSPEEVGQLPLRLPEDGEGKADE